MAASLVAKLRSRTQGYLRSPGDIATSVAGELKATLLGKSIESTDKPPSGNLAAYDAMLQGRFFAERRTRGDYAKAVDVLPEGDSARSRLCTGLCATGHCAAMVQRLGGEQQGTRTHERTGPGECEKGGGTRAIGNRRGRSRHQPGLVGFRLRKRRGVAQESRRARSIQCRDAVSTGGRHLFPGTNG